MGRRAAGGQRKTRAVASCRELEDLVFRGFGGGVLRILLVIHGPLVEQL